MRYIILVHEEKNIQPILALFKSEWFSEYTNEYMYISRHTDKQAERQYVQIEYCQESECDLTEEDKAVLSALDSPKYSLVRYSDLQFLKLVLKIIAENVPVYVDSNYDNLIKGSDFNAIIATLDKLPG